MSDSLKQITHYLKDSQDKAERHLKRYLPPEPAVERVRDIFDQDNPLKAVMKTPSNAQSSLLTLNFGQRLPSLDCCADCLCATTESYSSDRLISGSIYTRNAYLPGSPVVYVNSVRLESNEYTEVNPESGQIAIGVAGDVITISYVYTTENCSEAICIDDRFPNCPGRKEIIGTALVFADRYDRDAGPDPLGGCGRYPYNQTTGIPIDITPVDGYLTSATIMYPGGENQYNGGIWEIVVAVDMTDWTSTSSFGLGVGPIDSVPATMLAGFNGFNVTVTGNIKVNLSGVKDVIQDQSPTVTLPSSAYGLNYIRFVQLPDLIAVRMWPQDEPEPSTWIAYLNASNATPAGSYVFEDMAQVTMNVVTINGNQIKVGMIKVYAGLDFGYYEHSDNKTWFNTSPYFGDFWRMISCFNTSFDGSIRFGQCPGGVGTGPAFVDQNGANIPELEIEIDYPVGSEGEGRVAYIVQNVFVAHNLFVGTLPWQTGYRTTPNLVTLKGKMRYTFTTDLGNLPLTIVELPIDTAPGSPPVASKTGFNGNVVFTAFGPHNEWVDFEATVHGNMGYGFNIPNIHATANASSKPPGDPPPHLHKITLDFNLEELYVSSDTICSAADVCNICIDDSEVIIAPLIPRE